MTANLLGKVYLVGAGPGDPELLTLKGKRFLEAADVVLFDELINGALLEHAPQNAELIYVGKKPGAQHADQEEIEAMLIQKARAGKCVVRLKGGDPCVFGRAGEEAQALKTAGVPFEIVPGISSAIAAPTYAGIPVTHRSVASSLAVVTGHTACGGYGSVDWGQLAHSVDTLVILMGLNHLGDIMASLLNGGCEPWRPVCLIEWGTRIEQKTLTGTAANIAARAVAAQFKSPTTIVVGDVVRLAEDLEWFQSTRQGSRNPDVATNLALVPPSGLESASADEI